MGFDKNKVLKAVFKTIAIVILPAVLFIIFGNKILRRNNYPFPSALLLSAYAVWDMDNGKQESLVDSSGKFTATAVNIKTVSGRFNKAKYFNGENSYIEVPINFKDWKAVTIAMWLRPQQKNEKDLAVIIDNGHNAGSNFVIQSVAAEFVQNDMWVWHCAGADISFKIPFDKWSHIMAVADGESGAIAVYVNGVCAGKAVTKSFEFNDTNLTIGKLSGENSRFFKGSVDEVVIFNRVIVEE